ncbi:MAG: hypothetical protein KQJ78_06545 [Deltaproteobacteria bacterium]|nr:hypothetical protein [Deltaproteobacteria bacterium]
MIVRIAKNMLLILAGMALAFIMAELFPENILRGGYWEGPWMRPDPLSVYRLLPGKVTCSFLYDFKAEITVGKDGFRSLLPLDHRSEKSCRIIILGHSQPFSAGCGDEESLQYYLAKVLKKKYHIDADIYNFSLPGSSLISQFNLLKKYGPTLAPTHVFYWGEPFDCIADWQKDLRNTVVREKFGYVANGWCPLGKWDVIRKWSLLARDYTSRSYIGTVRMMHVIPVALEDLYALCTGAKVSWTSLESGQEAAPHAPPPRPQDVSYKDMEKYVKQTLGADFLYSRLWHKDWDRFPKNNHLSPKGSKKAAVWLAAWIAKTQP